MATLPVVVGGDAGVTRPWPVERVGEEPRVLPLLVAVVVLVLSSCDDDSFSTMRLGSTLTTSTGGVCGGDGCCCCCCVFLLWLLMCCSNRLCRGCKGPSVLLLLGGVFWMANVDDGCCCCRVALSLLWLGSSFLCGDNMPCKNCPANLGKSCPADRA